MRSGWKRLLTLGYPYSGQLMQALWHNVAFFLGTMALQNTVAPPWTKRWGRGPGPWSQTAEGGPRLCRTICTIVWLNSTLIGFRHLIARLSL